MNFIPYFEKVVQKKKKKNYKTDFISELRNQI